MKSPEPHGISDKARVGIDVSRFRREWNATRLDLYRKHLQVTVTRTSPLLEAAAATLGVSVAAEMWRLRPPGEWPNEVLTLSARLYRLGCGIAPHGRRGFVLSASGEILAGGSGARAHCFKLLVQRGAVEFSLLIGKVSVRTDAGLATIVLPFPLPDVVTTCVVGRPVAELVSHPILADPAHRIESVGWSRGKTILKVATGQVPFAMPWRRLLRRPGSAQA